MALVDLPDGRTGLSQGQPRRHRGLVPVESHADQGLIDVPQGVDPGDRFLS